MTIAGREIAPTVSLGNWLTIATLLVGMAMGWQAMASTSQHQAKQLQAVEMRVAQMETRMETRVSQDAQKQVELIQALTELRADLKYLREAVDQLQQLQQSTRVNP
jgi:pyruvate dehydrogenase complex dehydrogenase (E1) component